MRKAYLLTALIIAVFALIVASSQFFTIQKAHSTFENYYAFRGCIKLLSKTDMSATCKIADGKTIKIVKYQEKWYLDGDLPVCYFNFCL